MTRDEACGLIKTLHRQVRTASLMRFAILACVLLGCFGSMIWDGGEARRDWPWLAAGAAVLAWMALMLLSVRQVRATNLASIHISGGRLDLAEQQLKAALNTFSLYRKAKLLACHNLAVVAHGRKEYRAAAELCTGLLAFRGGLSHGVARLCRMLLADCRLLMGDPASAVRALEPLSVTDPTLPLPEQMLLLPLELRCQIARGEYDRAAACLAGKVRLAELLESPKAALVHSLLAKACDQLGNSDTAGFLRRRAELYYNLDEIAEELPLSSDSVQSVQSADNNIDN